MNFEKLFIFINKLFYRSIFLIFKLGIIVEHKKREESNIYDIKFIDV